MHAQFKPIQKIHIYLCQELFLASYGVVKPLHQQRMKLLQDQSGPFHLPGALSFTAI